MNILFVAKYYFGNSDLVMLSTELAHRKHHVSIVTSFSQVDRHKRQDGVNIFELSPWFKIHSINYPLLFPFSRIYKIVQEQDIDIIHALSDFSLHTASSASVSRATNVPFIYTVQGMGRRTGHLLMDGLIEVYKHTIQRAIARRATKVILLSERLMTYATKLGVKKSKIVTIPSGIDYNFFDPENPEVKKKAASLREELNITANIVIGYVGRLIPTKGLAYLISAMRQIQFEYPNIVLLIVGDGPQRANLEMMTKDLKIKTILAGWQVDVLQYYAIMDIFVLPSLFEGLPNVMLEAMAMKKAIVATNVGGNPDLIKSEKNGFLVPAGDDRQIASALKKLIVNNNLRTNMGIINREIIKKFFSLNKAVEKVEKVYNEVYENYIVNSEDGGKVSV